jgi:hypothetical protein
MAANGETTESEHASGAGLEAIIARLLERSRQPRRWDNEKCALAEK